MLIKCELKNNHLCSTRNENDKVKAFKSIYCGNNYFRIIMQTFFVTTHKVFVFCNKKS